MLGVWQHEGWATLINTKHTRAPARTRACTDLTRATAASTHAHASSALRHNDRVCRFEQDLSNVHRGLYTSRVLFKTEAQRTAAQSPGRGDGAPQRRTYNRTPRATVGSRPAPKRRPLAPGPRSVAHSRTPPHATAQVDMNHHPGETAHGPLWASQRRPSYRSLSVRATVPGCGAHGADAPTHCPQVVRRNTPHGGCRTLPAQILVRCACIAFTVSRNAPNADGPPPGLGHADYPLVCPSVS